MKEFTSQTGGRHTYIDELKDNDEFNARLAKSLKKYQLPNS